MERSAAFLTLLGLLLGLVSTLPNKDDWDIYSFHINSTVTSRYATTTITSRVTNCRDESKEIEFHVRIPKNAFITKFRMLIDGAVYDGVVKAKEQAERQYTAAVSRGESAGIVSSVGRTLEEFKTSVTVAAHEKVTFELTYEELLKRRLGKYELQIHARPMQPVTDFKVDVHIKEEAGINFIEINGGLSTKELANAITKAVTEKQAWIYFYPTVDQQKVCDSCSDKGLDGELVIFYDVKRDVPFGDVMIGDGYFVHHFAPSLPRIPKNVVFVIDQSGSMHGQKIQQTRMALVHILSDLAEDDFFGLITFDSSIFHWKRELVQATQRNINQAKTFAENIQARGSTDINKAVLEGARMLNAGPRVGSASILILLTDGAPTTGETNTENIRVNVKRAIAARFPLYCLGFGFDVKFELLEKMSLENNGAARRIYEDSDADLQLQGFYEEVATPLLTGVTMIYTGGTKLTQTTFSQYYQGSEIVVAGVIRNNNINNFIPEVVALSRNTRMTFSNPHATTGSIGTALDDRIQRLWAYLTVKQLMEKELQLSGPEKEKVKREAMDLSLQYSFVTPLTSMVVTKPPGEHSAVLNKPQEGRSGLGGSAGSGDVVLLAASNPAGSLTLPPFHSPGIALPLPPATGSFALPPHDFPYIARRPHPTRGPSKGRSHVTFHPGSAAFLKPPTRVFPTHRSRTTTTTRPNKIPVTRTTTTTTTTEAPLSPTQRFLLRPAKLSLPLCFDLPTSTNVKLLHHPSKELSVNGEIGPENNGGFRRIIINVQSDLSIEVDTADVTVKEGRISTRHLGQSHVTAGRAAVIIRDKEVDVSVGGVRLVILIHEISGRKFLWPVFRQLPLDDEAEGVLVVHLGFEEEKGSVTTVKVKGREVDISRSRAVDYSVPVPTAVDCWLLSSQAAFQRPTSDFYN